MCKITKIKELGRKLFVPFCRNKKSFCPEAFSDDLSAEIKKTNFCPETFSDDLDRKLGNLISNNFPLNRDNFNKTFNQFVNLIAESID